MENNNKTLNSAERDKIPNATMYITEITEFPKKGFILSIRPDYVEIAREFLKTLNSDEFIQIETQENPSTSRLSPALQNFLDNVSCGAFFQSGSVRKVTFHSSAVRNHYAKIFVKDTFGLTSRINCQIYYIESGNGKPCSTLNNISQHNNDTLKGVRRTPLHPVSRANHQEQKTISNLMHSSFFILDCMMEITKKLTHISEERDVRSSAFNMIDVSSHFERFISRIQ